MNDAELVEVQVSGVGMIIPAKKEEECSNECTCGIERSDAQPEEPEQ
jgi:hypothetical protein